MPKTPLHPLDLGPADFDLSFKVFHELMAKKISEILLVSSPYDAFIMEEDGRLAERIIQEYRGLNLSRPPRLSWVATAQEALQKLEQRRFDMVITMPRLDDMDPFELCGRIKAGHADLPVIMLAHNTSSIPAAMSPAARQTIDKTFVWCGNTDLLLAIIKNVEDEWNVAFDTDRAKVRVIILVEDSPYYRSTLLPLLYKEIVSQTQNLMEDSLNEEHRLVRMRARPKILIAKNYEEAEQLYRQYKDYVLCVLSDVRYPKGGRMDDAAGFKLLSRIKQESPDTAVLNLSSEEANRAKAAHIPAVFLNKNSAGLHTDIRAFFRKHLGFGDFIFRMPDGQKIARASNLRALEKILPTVPDDSVYFHATQNGFSLWLMARSEIQLASRLRPLKASDFENARHIKEYLINCIRLRRKHLQQGVVADFVTGDFDAEADFIRIGRGSLGGKARGLAFISTRLRSNPEIQQKYPQMDIRIPRTLALCTEGFDAFVNENQLADLPLDEMTDQQIGARFLTAEFPHWLQHDLKQFLEGVRFPLAVRSSSLLEDAQYQPFAGIYRTYMVPNNHADLNIRLERLISAVKLVYASVFFKESRSFARSTLMRTEDEKMAVILQEMTGRQYGAHFYPAISGVAQSYNFYPLAPLKAEEGIAHLAIGLGKTVVEGGTSFRFAPKHPQFLPQFGTVDDYLEKAQRALYALDMQVFPENLESADDPTLVKLDIEEAMQHTAIRQLAGTYIPEDHRIRDTVQPSGYPVLTFASILKHKSLPLSEILFDVLQLGRQGMGCPVEIEFAVNLPASPDQKPEFALLQIRPMALKVQNMDVNICDSDRCNCFGYSVQALGNGVFTDIEHIIYVKPQNFDPARTLDIAGEIGKLNASFSGDPRKYLLIGPGRWGSADRWLGIPVQWGDISSVGAIVEAAIDKLQADPSQGTHFFHNITSMGISYITVATNSSSYVDWNWLDAQAHVLETEFVRHLHLNAPLTLKIDGKQSQAVLLKPDTNAEAPQ